MKNNLAMYADIKQKKQFIKRRAKLIKTAWKNGIVGVELPNEKLDVETNDFFTNTRDEITKY